jgi:hypothetical protein
MNDLIHYTSLLAEIRRRIQSAQLRAVLGGERGTDEEGNDA